MVNDANPSGRVTGQNVSLLNRLLNKPFIMCVTLRQPVGGKNNQRKRLLSKGPNILAVLVLL